MVRSRPRAAHRLAGWSSVLLLVLASVPAMAADPQALVGQQVDVTLSTGETISNVRVVKVSPGKDGGLLSLSIADESGGRPKQLSANRVREVSPPGGHAMWVFDPARKMLAPPDQVAKRRAAGKAKEDADTEHAPRPAGSQVLRLGGPWPELTDQQQGRAVEEQRAYLQQVGATVPNRGMQLYETKRFLFYSDIPASFVKSTYVPYLDSMYTQLCGAYGIDPTSNIWKGKGVIIAFAQQASFQAFEAAFFTPLAQESIRGLSHMQGNGNVVISCYAFSDPKTFAAVMVHETTHGFNFRYKAFQVLPNWLDEGIAEWVAQTVVVGDTSVRRKVDLALAQMRSTHSLGGDYFTAQNIRDWHYGVAASMIDFLIKYNPNATPTRTHTSTSRSKRKAGEPAAFRKLVEGIKDGKRWEDSLQEAYHCTPGELVSAYGRAMGIADLRP